MFLLDTNVCIHFMKHTHPQLTEKLLSLEPSELCLSALTVYELEYGAEKSKWGEKTRQKLAMFLAPFRILPFTTEDALTAAKIRGYLERKGTRIGPYDILIAAQALTRSIPIVTHNTGEFRRVPGLSVEDWTE